MKIRVSDRIIDKLQKRHSVSIEEVEQCFCNREGRVLEETREEHRTNPPTQWFIAETNGGRLLKVVYVLTVIGNKGLIDLRTAYPPNADEIAIYERHGK